MVWNQPAAHLQSEGWGNSISTTSQNKYATYPETYKFSIGSSTCINSLELYEPDGGNLENKL